MRTTPIRWAAARQPPTVWLYGRVSQETRSGRGAGRSVNQQLTIGKRIAGENEWRIGGVYQDNDRSASEYARRSREDWERLLDDINAKARDGDILWVWELSRGTRERLVWANLVEVCKRKRMWIGVNHKVFDPHDADDMHSLDQMMAAAIHESAKTRERVSRDIQAHADEGGLHGPTGYGYRRIYDPATRELIRQELHPDQAPIIREAARRYLTGESIGEIVKDLNRRKIPTERGRVAGEIIVDKDGTERVCQGWNGKVLRESLLRPTLMGMRGHNGRLIAPEEGRGWPILIDPEDWYAIRQKLTTKTRDNYSRRGTVMYPLSGAAVCDVCGGRIGSAGKTRVGVAKYNCMGLWAGAPSGHVTRKHTTLDADVEVLLVRRFSMPDVLDAYRPQGPSPVELQELSRELSELREDLELARAATQTRGPRRMRMTDFLRVQADYGARIEELEAQLRPQAVSPMLEELAGPTPADVLRVWRAWTPYQQREALRAAAEEIRVLQVGKGRLNVPPEESVFIRWVGE